MPLCLLEIIYTIFNRVYNFLGGKKKHQKLRYSRFRIFIVTPVVKVDSCDSLAGMLCYKTPPQNKQ